MSNTVFLVAGGTGGHINAAISVGESLDKTYDVKYITGTRYLDYKLFEGKDVTHFSSKPLRSKNPIVIAKNTFQNIVVFLRFVVMLLKSRPKFVVGAGGYICGPTLFASYILGIKVFIIEQNAVMGITNKILAKFAKKVFVNFKDTKGLENNRKVIVTGNPIRNKIKFAKQDFEEGLIKVLVFGGSLGAVQINEAIRELVKMPISKKIHIKHQVGKDNIKEIHEIESSYIYEQFDYMEDMNKMFSWANIIISRAGASSISELKVVAKPSLLIPYPAATDNHQFYNAINLKKEASFSVEVLDQSLKGVDLAMILRSHLEVLISDENKMKNKASEECKAANVRIKEEIEKCLE